MTDWLEVGRVGRAHGLRGDVLVSLLTERTSRLEPGATLRAGGADLEVATSRPHQGRWIVRFEGVDDRSAAERLHGLVLEAEAVDDDEGELWVHQVVGAEVVTVDGRECGRVASVLANPAHDLLVLEDETLVPVVFVVDEQSTDRRLVIDPPEGLVP